MKYTETLFWILDKVGVKMDTLEVQNKVFQEKMDFVHSLGLKCDHVGWCELPLSNPRTPDILKKISEFCKERGWQARGVYNRHYPDIESNWYELIPTYFKTNTRCGTIETTTEDGKRLRIPVIHAFHELTPDPKRGGHDIYVPERFYEFCTQNHIDGLDFCWIQDKGKYHAEQYFQVYGNYLIPQIAADFDIDDIEKSRNSLIHEAGGWLPEIVNVLHVLQHINLQECYLASDLPDGGISYAYIPPSFSCGGRHKILIHNDIAQLLLQQRILPASALRTAPVVETLPGGYSLHATQPIDRPITKHFEYMQSEYEKLKKTPRPARMVSEKEALKVLRLSKKERKGDFQNALAKAKRQALFDTGYNPMIPYYAVANGGFLSDEYEFLPVACAMRETELFHEVLAKDDLVYPKPKGVIIASCPNGDVILLCQNGEVARFSHEVPEIIELWPTLAQFFADTIHG